MSSHARKSRTDNSGRINFDETVLTKTRSFGTMCTKSAERKGTKDVYDAT